jgi:hypothetical protein
MALRALALCALAMGGCTILYGNPRDGGGADFADSDLAGADLTGSDGPVGDLAPAVLWTQQISNTVQSLNAVWGCSATNVYAAGAGGTVLHAIAPGTWTAKTAGTAPLYAIGGLSCTDVFVVGQGGAMFLTKNDDLYLPQAPGTASDLHGVFPLFMNVVVAGKGGTVLRSNAGLSVWTAMTSNTGADLLTLTGRAGLLWAVGSSGAIQHFDSVTWKSQPSGTAVTLRGVFLPAAGNDVWVVGDGGTVLHSTNLGGAWAPVVVPISVNYLGVWGSSGQDVYVVGELGVILHTVDGGATWAREAGPGTATLRAVWGSGASNVYAVGDDGTVLHYP